MELFSLAPTPTSTHRYTLPLSPSWTIGSVPHGGYITSVLLSVAKLHFATTLSSCNQPDTLSVQLSFLRRTQTGPATVTVQDLKLGRQSSVIYVSLEQEGREEVVGFITQTDFGREEGVGFGMDWGIYPPPPVVTGSFGEMDRGRDANWGERKVWPLHRFRPAMGMMRSWFPRGGQLGKGIVDQWVCPRDDDKRWTTDCLGFIVDAFPQIVESLEFGGDLYGVELEERYTQEEQQEMMDKKGAGRKWYPTVSLNMEVKKRLPEEGVRFLFVRVQCKVMQNGRYDLEVIVKDMEGDVVALSNHVVLAVPAERNTAKRRGKL
ncbi:hypothetical protein K470DRAFT_253566 [Piedraia hortae CBS 480.64]|uniref:Thioesterase/thiol ester dehydrase-isomerase n=1 Tax=Piedraia hortae CBS 480.64 TaxID=1314780 RepID=A0A6A7BRX5_9PEZI|nr:hypothetical protein K470DRAFT_253566 [Piedraia hortae CBS 480.64]